ncbi:competence type IV pilus assembly protein ComGB [Neobacillus mesonae]|uniref:competence type IV pilus assembly protein ComGB n=1 Tax=Neobacillus mesonae TaxID=1193713 RepID=UPI00203DD420|nr:competence type IV pilus assembly protein ComGB [Neobacillus mesonae]MCM3566622.1 type II secretion system F family protein [Neobacillus mesonae]
MINDKWTMNEQASFLRRVGELLARGYPIAEAIESISYHLSDYRKGELHECLIELQRGVPFHDVLETLGFHQDLIGYVYFAEQHGSFADALLEGSSLVLLKDKDLKKLLKLLQYPVLLITITGFLFVFIQRTLLPRFITLFNSLGLEANFFTKVIYAFEEYFPIGVELLSAILSITAIYYFFSFRKLSVLKQRALLARIPIIGRILKLLFTHYFSIQLSFLLSGGVSVSEALILFEKNKRQPLYSELGKEIKRKLLTGERLETILAAIYIFEKEFPMIIKHGQENGKLEQELLFFSKHCITVMEELIENSLKIIQPILYLFIGFLVVSMYLAILLPMFHLLDGI